MLDSRAHHPGSEHVAEEGSRQDREDAPVLRLANRRRKPLGRPSLHGLGPHSRRREAKERQKLGAGGEVSRERVDNADDPIPSAKAIEGLRAILARRVPRGSDARKEALVTFFGGLSPPEAARMHWLLSKPDEPLRRSLSSRLRPRTADNLVRDLGRSVAGLKPETAPENMSAERLLEEHEAVGERLAAAAAEPETSKERAAEAAREEELGAELARRGLAFSEASPWRLREIEHDRKLDAATQTGDYSGVDVDRATANMKGKVRPLSGDWLDSIGSYRWLERTPEGRLVETERPAKDKSLKNEDLRWIFEGSVQVTYLDSARKRLVVARVPFDREPGGAGGKKFVLEIWWKVANDFEYKAISHWVDMAQYGHDYAVGQILRPILGDEVFHRMMKADVVSSVPGLAAGKAASRLSRPPGGGRREAGAGEAGSRAEKARSRSVAGGVVSFEDRGQRYHFDMTNERLVGMDGVSGVATGPREAYRIRRAGRQAQPSQITRGIKQPDGTFKVETFDNRPRAGMPADRGHTAAHAAGGGTDANLVPMNRDLNRGWSAEGRKWIAGEKYLRDKPGTEYWIRYEYD
jgi:hypothetical protein